MVGTIVVDEPLGGCCCGCCCTAGACVGALVVVVVDGGGGGALTFVAAMGDNDVGLVVWAFKGFAGDVLFEFAVPCPPPSTRGAFVGANVVVFCAVAISKTCRKSTTQRMVVTKRTPRPVLLQPAFIRFRLMMLFPVFMGTSKLV